MALPIQQFIERLSHSGLMTAEQVSAFEDRLPPEKRPGDGQALAQALVRGENSPSTRQPRSTRAKPTGWSLANTQCSTRSARGEWASSSRCGTAA